MSNQIDANDRAKKLGLIGWGLFLLWLGILFVGDVGTGVGFLGIGVITLGVQIARKSVGLSFEGFWLVVGSFFLAAAVWEFLNPRLPLIAVVLVLAGVALIRSAIKGSSSSSS